MSGPKSPVSGWQCTVAALCLAGDASGQAPIAIDAARLNETMATMRTFGGSAEGGSLRVAYSDANRRALDFLAGLMADAGLETHIDVAGNLIGRREGTVPGLGAIISGSHIDSVPNGGHYDGVVGVMAGIEVARTLNEADETLRHPLEIIVWSNEEGGKTGSRAFNGSVRTSELALPSLGERSLGEGMRFLGGDPERIDDAVRQPGAMAGYVELHVEQGGILDRQDIDIGVVDGIVGIRRWNVAVEGFANHAGTTPMDQRSDAMVAAARLISAVRDIATMEPGRQVATVGRIQATPGAPNVIAGKVVFSLEIRDLHMDKIDLLFGRIGAAATDLAGATDTSIAFERFYESPAAITDTRISTLIEQSADTLGLTSMHMPSGAGHDAQSLAPIGPIGMIFVPSEAGISHAPAEFTREEDIGNGAGVLLMTLLGMDRILD